MGNAWKHFKTITEHKLLVMINCFRVGLIKQGLLHDLSKYMPEEFMTGVKYYQGTRSPNAAEKEDLGYSKAWLHHKGRNKHHFEYWIDYSVNKEEGLIGTKMELRYVIEMAMDRIAASKIYRGKYYTNADPWNYYSHLSKYMIIHKDTRALLERILIMLRDEGEKKAFNYMRYMLKKGTY